MLDVQGVSAGYGAVQVLSDVSLHVDEGEVVAVLGANGAGKSTLMNTLVGIVPARTGTISFLGKSIRGWKTEAIARSGLTLVPEGRRVFSALTVEENLRMGAYGRRDRTAAANDLVELLERFPILAQRRRQPAGTLSGGEQQQLAIARALMSRPRLVLLDEPSLGLAPVVVEVVFELIRQLNEDGLTFVIVEQSVTQALDVSDRVYVLAGGRVVAEGTSEEMTAAAERLEASYLGGNE